MLRRRSHPDPTGDARALLFRLAEAEFGLEAVTERRTVHGISPAGAPAAVRDALDAFSTLERTARMNVPRSVRYHIGQAVDALEAGHFEVARVQISRAGREFEEHLRDRRRWYAPDDRLDWDA